MVIDYKKWEVWEKALDSYDQKLDNERALPKVTRLDKPGRVTIGPCNSGLTFPSDDKKVLQQPQGTVTAIKHSLSSTKPKEVTVLTKNGSQCSAFMWSQSTNEVHLSLFVPENTQGKFVTINLTSKELSVRLAFSNTVSTPLPYWILSADGKELSFKKEFANYVSAPGEPSTYNGFVTEEDREYDMVDWELKDLFIEDEKKRILSILLRKTVPSSGTIIWWSKVFVDVQDEVEIDTRKIEERKLYNQKVENETEGGASRDPWEEAQRIFKEKRSLIKK